MPKLAFFGVNVGHDPVYDPKLIAKAGFNAIRIVAQKSTELADYARRCHDAGVAFGLCFPNESFAGFANYVEAAIFYVSKYGDLVDVWMLGNESDGQDGTNPESSVLSAAKFASMAEAFINALNGRAGRRAPLYAIGTVTGDPNRIKDYNLAGFDGLDNHAYAQWPNTVNAMLAGYNQYDAKFGLKTRIISEFGWPHPDPAQRGAYIRDMVRVFEDNPKVIGAWVYCWDQAQHAQPFGLVNGSTFTAAIPPIQSLGYGGTFVAGSTPPGPTFQFILGIKDKADALRAAGVDIGAPTMNEKYPWDGAPWSYQRTTKGKFEYDKQTNSVQFFPAL